MDVGGSSEMTIMITFQAETSFASLMGDGGVEEFIRKCREKLEAELEPLKAITVMKQIAINAAGNKPQAVPKQDVPA